MSRINLNSVHVPYKSTMSAYVSALLSLLRLLDLFEFSSTYECTMFLVIEYAKKYKT